MNSKNSLLPFILLAITTTSIAVCLICANNLNGRSRTTYASPSTVRIYSDLPGYPNIEVGAILSTHGPGDWSDRLTQIDSVTIDDTHIIVRIPLTALPPNGPKSHPSRQPHTPNP